MRLFKIFIILSVFSTFAVEKGNFARFHRILKDFKYSTYRVSDKDIYGNFWYSTSYDKKTPQKDDIAIGSDINEDFSRELKGDAGFKGEWISSTPYFQNSQILAAKGNVVSSEKSKVSYYPIVDLSRTSEEKKSEISGLLEYDVKFEKHIRNKKLYDLPFYGINGNLEVSGSEEKDEYLQNTNEDSTLFRQSKRKENDVVASIRLEPVFGIGKKKPIIPVYKAFEIERSLKECGIIKENLSEKTMHRITELIISSNSIKLRNEFYKKYLMEKLEKILIEDSCISETSLNAYSLFKIYETFETVIPEFFTGFSGSIHFTSMYKFEMWYGNMVRLMPEEEVTANTFFTIDCKVYCQLSLCYPVVPRLFLSLTLEQFQKKSILYGTYHLLVTNRILVSSGINSLWGHYSEYSRIKGFLDFKFFIEDHIAVNCSLEKSTISSISNNNVFKRKDKSREELITLGLNYDF